MDENEEAIEKFKEKKRFYILPTLTKQLIVEVVDYNEVLLGRIIMGNKDELLQALDDHIEEDNTIDVDPGEN